MKYTFHSQEAASAFQAGVIFACDEEIPYIFDIKEEDTGRFTVTVTDRRDEEMRRVKAEFDAGMHVPYEEARREKYGV